MNKFNLDLRDISNERNRSPIFIIDKKKPNFSRHLHNKSEVFDPHDS